MLSVRELLNQVWALFRQAGIADDLTIIEHIAALLLLKHPPDSNNELRPRVPPARPGLDTDTIQRILTEAAAQAGGAAVLFERHVLFRLSSMLPGGRYPTPRHIVISLLRLADVAPTHRLADFACGSGGFLVHRRIEGSGLTEQTVGVELAPEWARLAWANVTLHGLPLPRITIGNALQVCGAEGILAGEAFDRIVMNPAFGEKIDPRLAETVFEFKVGSRSETALTALAVHRLAADGRAAVLVPSGLLFSNSTGERELRRRLVNELELEAVCSLPREAFQPYSTLQTHLIVVRNRKPVEHSRTWFLQVERDGYPAGRGRDLTLPPVGLSDLPFLEGVFAVCNTTFDATLGASEKPLLGLKKITATDGTLLGVVLEAVESAILTEVERFPATDKTPAFLLAEGHHPADAHHVCIEINLDSGETRAIPNRDALLTERYQLRRQDPAPGTVLFRGDSTGQAVALSIDGRLLGVTVAQSVLQTQTYDLRPERYIKAPEEVIPAASPANLLASLRRRQREFQEHIDALLGHLDLAPLADHTLPSPLLTQDGKVVEPYGVLSREQQAVWEHVRKKVQTLREGTTSYDTAVLFTPEEVNPDNNAEVSETTHSTLDLLERMGVIVPVTIADANTGEPVAFYRRVTERDLWRLEMEALDSEAERV
jgi:hypothetical protein